MLSESESNIEVKLFVVHKSIHPSNKQVLQFSKDFSIPCQSSYLLKIATIHPFYSSPLPFKGDIIYG